MEENHRPFLIVERRASERARDMAGCVAQAMLPGLFGGIPLFGWLE